MMDKISISKVIEFRRKKKTSAQATLINNLKSAKKEKSKDGGDYWTTSLSAIGNTFKTDDRGLIAEKISELLKKHDEKSKKTSKQMYLRNIEILHNVEDFDFSVLKPAVNLKYISKPHEKSIIKINTVPAQIRPHHVFTYKENDINKLGAIWFVCNINKYKLEELSIFTDALYRYLYLHHADHFYINSSVCMVFDVSTLTCLTYKQIEDGEVSSLLDPTIESVKKLL